jgi:hypothetical protein
MKEERKVEYGINKKEKGIKRELKIYGEVKMI